MIAQIVLILLLAVGAVAAETAGDPTPQLMATLQSQASLFEKARACQRLGEVGDRTAVPALAALLADPHLSAYARSGLEGIAGPEAAEALRAAVGRLTGSLRAGAIDSLGVLRDPGAVPILRALAADASSGAAREALFALGRIASDQAIAEIRAAMARETGELRTDAASACLLAAERLLAAGRKAEAAQLYDTVLRTQASPAHTAGAVRGAILARQPEASAFLVEQLRSKNRVTRNAALQTIREIPGPAMASVLNAELERADPELEALLLIAFLDCHNEASARAAADRVTSPHAEVRKAALRALGRIGSARKTGVLLQALARAVSAEESSLATDALRRLPGLGVDEQILQALPSADAAQRVRLIRLLENRGNTTAVPALLEHARSADPSVSVAALRALQALAGPDAVPALVALYKSRADDASLAAAESALVGLCARVGGRAAAGEAAWAELRQAATAEARLRWMRLLVSLAHAPALPVILSAVNAPEDAVAEGACELLGGWPGPEPMDALFDAMEKHPRPSVRRRALASVLQLATAAADEHQRPDPVIAGWFGRADRAAESPEERRRVVSGLARLKVMESFRLLSGRLSDPATATEAALAIVQIAPALVAHEEAGAVKAALESIAATQKPPLRDQALKIAQGMSLGGRREPIFDGRSLAGWEGNTNVWRVRDGAIVGGSLAGNPRNEFLAVTRARTNFVLRLEYKLVGTDGFINGGVQIRSVRVKEPPNEMSGYQADIGAGFSGVLYDESRRNKILARGPEEQAKRLEKPGDWNRYEIRCEGPRIQLLLNGERTVDYTEPDSTIPQYGLIALQIHGDCKAEISFRNLTVENLP